MAQYTYQINGVTVGFDRHAIHITNDCALKGYLAKWGHGERTLATDIKSKFRNIYGTELNISVDSLNVQL